MDPYAQAFDRIRKVLRKSSTAQRPDIIVFAIRVPPAPAPVQLKITPLEVKFREGAMSNTAIAEALDQAANLGDLLDALWVQAAPTELWASCRPALLAQCLDFAFRVYADPAVHGRTQPDWTGLHERVLGGVLGRTAAITVTAAGRLFVFDESTSTTISDMDGDTRQDTGLALSRPRRARPRGASISPSRPAWGGRQRPRPHRQRRSCRRHLRLPPS
jgi:hypothetical protein